MKQACDSHRSRTGARAHEHKTYNDKLSACIHHVFTLLLSPLKMQGERRRVGSIRKTESINGLIGWGNTTARRQA